MQTFTWFAFSKSVPECEKPVFCVCERASVFKKKEENQHVCCYCSKAALASQGSEVKPLTLHDA